MSTEDKESKKRECEEDPQEPSSEPRSKKPRIQLPPFKDIDWRKCFIGQFQRSHETKGCISCKLAAFQRVYQDESKKPYATVSVNGMARVPLKCAQAALYAIFSNHQDDLINGIAGTKELTDMLIPVMIEPVPDRPSPSSTDAEEIQALCSKIKPGWPELELVADRIAFLSKRSM